MLDYWKLWISDKEQIERVMQNPNFKIHRLIDDSGEVIEITGTYKYWTLRQKLTPHRLEITGSVHKYWNKGTNENDFTFSNIGKAINAFCLEFDISPSFAFVINLEFAVNLQLPIDASEIMQQIICFNNREPLRPYEERPDFYFLEFRNSDFYLKVYDKGKQARHAWNMRNTPNTLRIEIKGMNSGFLKEMGITTLSDIQLLSLQVLGRKLAITVKRHLVFDDDTIELKALNQYDRKLYRHLSNPRNWSRVKGDKKSGVKDREARFKRIVEKYGKRKIYSLITRAIQGKL